MSEDYVGGRLRCSKKEFCICGIRVFIYGLEELSDSTKISCLWLLHPRLQDQSYMEPVAFSAIQAWNDYATKRSGEGRPGLIAASFDQRNHGSRMIDPRSNEDWRSGNDTHALDMFGIIHGTVLDTAQLISYLSSYAFSSSTRKIGQNLVCGVSLGGHAAWQALFTEPRITAGVSVIGSPDLRRLLEDRARLSKRESWKQGNLYGSEDFPAGFLEAMQLQDPASKIFSGLNIPNDEGQVEGELSSLDQDLLKRRLSEAIKGKTLLNLSGAEDKLVPHRSSKPFVQWLLKNAANRSDIYGCDFHLEDKLFSGVGHTFCPDMAREVDRFIVESVGNFWAIHSEETAKM